MSAPSGPTVSTSAVATCSAALAVVLTSFALSGILADGRWVLPAMLTVALLAGVGMAGRKLRWWAPLVVLAQLAVLLTWLAARFSGEAFLGVIPGPSAVAELAEVISSALATMREGTPPLPADPGVQCLVCLGLGLVALLVDAIAVAAGAPAVAGLVLLCVFAVPASLADTMLPWWAFAAGAIGFALLLSSGGHHRRWGPREPRTAVAHSLFGSRSTAVTGAAAVFALLLGAAFTGVGTEGRLPGSDPQGGDSATGGIGLRPFTSLRGQLNRDEVVELFRVRGLPRETYLRAMTLRKFDPASGWKLEGLTRGVGTEAELPLPDGTHRVEGTPARAEIKPVGYRDPWLPVFGMPTRVSGMGPDWRYDSAAGIVFTQIAQDSKPYVEEFVLPDPSPEQLRNAQGPVEVDPAYLDIRGIPPEIIRLAERLTAHDRTKFDQAVSLNRYFTDPGNGFVYDLTTAPPTTGDALSDFLLRGKRGFCEQYASSMAVLLRSIGIPSRVAVGFTAGYADGDERVITTQDAHAWVEAYFPGYGWTTFDPTPLDDGRGAEEAAPGEPPRTAEQAPAESAAPVPPGQAPNEPGGEVRAAPEGPNGAWGPLVGALVLVLALLATPAGVRELRRRQRMRAIAEGAPDAASAAWRELLDESRDRGGRPEPAGTVRRVGTWLVDRHGLDEPGANALRAVVEAVEHEWYAPAGHLVDVDLREALDEVLASLSRQAPLPWRARLLPRSVLEPVRARG